VIKKYDTARTLYQRVLADESVTKKIKAILTRQYRTLNPAQIRRDLSCAQRATARPDHPAHPAAQHTGRPSQAQSSESTKPRSRAS
jgi:hypothetical protein